MTKPNAAKWIVPVGLAITLVFTGACGGGADTDGQAATESTEAEGAASMTTPTGTPESEGAATQAAATVEITDFAYEPKQITVKVGDTVKWVNNDAFLHTVTSGAVDGPENKPDGKFDEDLPDAGSEATVTFDEAGTFTYFCEQHNAMDGVVIVE